MSKLTRVVALTKPRAREALRLKLGDSAADKTNNYVGSRNRGLISIHAKNIAVNIY